MAQNTNTGGPGESPRPRQPAGRGTAKARGAFDARRFLMSAGIERTVVDYREGAVVFHQGDAADHVFYIQAGSIKLSVVSKTGREAIVAILGPRDFFGEACLAGQAMRIGSAMATTQSRVVTIAKVQMQRLLHDEHAMSDRFIAHMLARNSRIEEDLIDQLFNSSEKRLARTLLLLARYGIQDTPARLVPRLSQESLAEMVGTTRSRVNFFLNKFKRLGFIDYDGRHPITINNSLLSVVLHD